MNVLTAVLILLLLFALRFLLPFGFVLLFGRFSNWFTQFD